MSAIASLLFAVSNQSGAIDRRLQADAIASVRHSNVACLSFVRSVSAVVVASAMVPWTTGSALSLLTELAKRSSGGCVPPWVRHQPSLADYAT
ncbi:MAG: hypothetical protein ACPH4G_09505 [Henriciella sp.]